MSAAIRDQQFAELSNGMRLHYASAGERGRPLILFLHGFPEFWYEWQEQLAEFGRDYYAVAPDLRGFNLSSMPPEVSDYKARHIVDDIRLLAAHLGYEKFVLVAHDWGGAIAWNFAITLPHLLHKLVMINSPHPYAFMRALTADPKQRAASEYMNWLRAPGSEGALAKDDFQLLDGFFTGRGQVHTGWFAGAVREKYHECWRRGLTGGINYYRVSPLHPPTTENQGPLALGLKPEDFRIQVPTRIIWGESDIALLPILLDGLDELIDDLRVERIPEGSHWIVHEQPERISRLIRGFLAE